MSTACGPPQGGGGQSHGDEGGAKVWFSCGHHKWMTLMIVEAFNGCLLRVLFYWAYYTTNGQSRDCHIGANRAVSFIASKLLVNHFPSVHNVLVPQERSPVVEVCPMWWTVQFFMFSRHRMFAAFSSVARFHKEQFLWNFTKLKTVTTPYQLFLSFYHLSLPQVCLIPSQSF